MDKFEIMKNNQCSNISRIMGFSFVGTQRVSNVVLNVSYTPSCCPLLVVRTHAVVVHVPRRSNGAKGSIKKTPRKFF